MNIIGHSLRIIDQRNNCFHLKTGLELTASVSCDIRKAIKACAHQAWDGIYLDAKEVIRIDLGGVNEVIHSYYTLKQISKKLVLVYRIDSPVEHWVKTTGLDKFIETAIVR